MIVFYSGSVNCFGRRGRWVIQNSRTILIVGVWCLQKARSSPHLSVTLIWIVRFLLTRCKVKPTSRQVGFMYLYPIDISQCFLSFLSLHLGLGHLKLVYNTTFDSRLILHRHFQHSTPYVHKNNFCSNFTAKITELKTKS